MDVTVRRVVITPWVFIQSPALRLHLCSPSCVVAETGRKGEYPGFLDFVFY